MKIQWQTFLAEQGAEISDGCVVHYGNPDLEHSVVTTGNVLADLSHEGLIGVAGVDALTFLQGQFTNDVRLVTPQRSQLSAWCTPKGRALASFRVLQQESGGFLLAMPSERVSVVLKRLRMYLLNSKAILRDASQEWLRLGCAGPTVSEALTKVIPILPDAIDQVVQTADYLIIRLRGPHPRFEILGNQSLLERLWEVITVRAAPVGAMAWGALDVLAGVPVITERTAEAFVPQMLNYVELEGLSFRKGCYTGQEVVARLHYLGKLKRRLFLARLGGGEGIPQPGDALWSSEGQTEPGRLVNVARDPAGEGFIVLAVLPLIEAQGGAVRWQGERGPILEFLPLPYPLVEGE